MIIPFTARKHIGPTPDGSSVDAPNITDADPSTTDSVFCRGVGGAFDDDWFILDCGSSVAIGQVQLSNVTFSNTNQGVNCWATNMPTATPGDAGTTQLGINWVAGAGAVFPSVTISGATVTGRYLLVLGLAATGQSMTLGGVLVSPPVILVPSLTATPALPGNVPSIILTGY